MARRRVFRTRAECPGVPDNLGPTCKQDKMIGREVILENASTSKVSVRFDGVVVGQLPDVVGKQVASAMNCGQSFTVTVERAFPIYNSEFKQAGANLDLRVEYLLEKGQPAINAPTIWRCIETPDRPHAPKSFFTRIAGVTFEERQRIIARCSVGERLILVRDPDNQFDQGAIKVMRSTGEQLGFIRSHISRAGQSSGLAFQMDRGDKIQCKIAEISGGKDKNLGVTIEITKGDVSSTSETSPKPNVISVHSNRGRLFLFAAVVLLFVAILVVFERG